MILSQKTRALTTRNLLKSLRNPDIVVFATAAPVAFALLFAYVFGNAMEMSARSYREYLIVGILVQTMLLTSTNTGIGLAMDNKQGMMDRFRSSPCARSQWWRPGEQRPRRESRRRGHADDRRARDGLAHPHRLPRGRGRVSPPRSLCVRPLLGGCVDRTEGAVARGALERRDARHAPLAFVSTAFVPTAGMPTPLRVAAEWNPVSAVVTGVRNLFGNVPEAAPVSEALPLQYPVVSRVIAIALVCGFAWTLAVPTALDTVIRSSPVWGPGQTHVRLREFQHDHAALRQRPIANCCVGGRGCLCHGRSRTRRRCAGCRPSIRLPDNDAAG